MTNVSEIVQDVLKITTNLYVHESEDGITIQGTWDDLSPEPDRSEVKNRLSEIRRSLMHEGFDVSEIMSEYGSAKIIVRDRNS